MSTRCADGPSPGRGNTAGSEVALIGAFPPPVGGQAIYNQRLAEELVARGIPVVPVDVSSRALDTDLPATRRRLVTLLASRRFSVYHLSISDTRVVGFEVIVGLASVLRRTPFVYNILAGRFAQRVAGYSLPHRFLLCWALRRAGRILVSNEMMATCVRALPFLSRAKVEVIGCKLPLGVEPTQDPDIARFLESGNPAIVAIGAMRTVYGFDLLVRACAVLQAGGLRPRLLAIVSGEGDPAAQQACEEAMREAGPLLQVTIRRDLPREVVLGAIRGAHVLARPTRADGDSLSVHEAQTLGTPVVASDAAPRPQGVILHRSDDPVSLAAAIREAIASSSSRMPEGVGVGDAVLVDRVAACYRSLCPERGRV
ncbi:MAG: glycosyltransferase family 4 protein [Candidatus Eisenbacteria bacterium]|nr:glycosyltransferase family 4 protein [Candidatus Eisenbacteria bacterium]